MDNKKEFIEQLRKTAKVFEPYVTDDRSINKRSKFIPLALCWWSSILNTSYLIEYQDSPLTIKQLDYIQREFFGTMGSLNDFSFSMEDLGIEANLANKRLGEDTDQLYLIFKKLKQDLNL